MKNLSSVILGLYFIVGLVLFGMFLVGIITSL